MRHNKVSICKTCGGTGRYWERSPANTYKCKTCAGNGVEWKRPYIDLTDNELECLKDGAGINNQWVIIRKVEHEKELRQDEHTD